MSQLWNQVMESKTVLKHNLFLMKTVTGEVSGAVWGFINLEDLQGNTPTVCLPTWRAVFTQFIRDNGHNTSRTCTCTHTHMHTHSCTHCCWDEDYPHTQTHTEVLHCCWDKRCNPHENTHKDTLKQVVNMLSDVQIVSQQTARTRLIWPSCSRLDLLRWT